MRAARMVSVRYPPSNKEAALWKPKILWKLKHKSFRMRPQ